MSAEIDWDLLLEQWDAAEPAVIKIEPTKVERSTEDLAVMAAEDKIREKRKAAKVAKEIEGIKSAEEVAKELEALESAPIPFKQLLRTIGADGILEQIYGPVGGQIEKEKLRQRVREYVREDLATEKVSEGWKPPVPLGISTFLSVEPEAPSFHVQGLWPHGGLVMLNAAKKWGKTTNVRHTVECVLTGQPLYGQFAIDSPLSRALVIDNELSHRQTWDMWQGSGLSDDQLILWRLRESLSTLAIRDEFVRKELVKAIADTGADLLVIDPLGPLLRANAWDENSNSDVGLCLDLLAEMAHDAGVTSMLIPHHTGHDGAHARGASVIGDKADAIWSGTLARPSDPYGARKFGAIGRSGVSQRPVELSWDEAKRQPFLTDAALDFEAGLAKSFVLAKVVEQGIREGITTTRPMQQYVRDAGLDARNEDINAELKAQKDKSRDE